MVVSNRDAALAAIRPRGDRTTSHWGAQGSISDVFSAYLVSGPRGTYLVEHLTLRDRRSATPPRSGCRRHAPDALPAPGRGRRRPQHLRHLDGQPGRRGRLYLIAETGGAVELLLYARTGPAGSRRQPWFGKTKQLLTTDPDREPRVRRVGPGRRPRLGAVAGREADWRCCCVRQRRAAARPTRTTVRHASASARRTRCSARRAPRRAGPSTWAGRDADVVRSGAPSCQLSQQPRTAALGAAAHGLPLSVQDPWIPPPDTGVASARTARLRPHSGRLPRRGRSGSP